MMVGAGLLRVCALAVLARLGAAQYFCKGLSDQQNEYIFRTQLVNGDDSSLFTGNISYACNQTTGGITYLQNLLVSFADPANPNSTMSVSASACPPFPPPLHPPTLRAPCRCCRCRTPAYAVRPAHRQAAPADLSMSAAGCSGRSGVYLNYTIGVEYPETVWAALADTDAGKYLDPNLKRRMVVSNGTTFTDMDPEFSIATLAAMAGEGRACNTPPPPGPVPVGAPPPPDCAQNVSGLLAQTGTDITFKIKSIEGASQHAKENPGLAFGMTATVSVLSQKNSKICAGEDAFCCAAKDKDGNCCCDPDEISSFCGSDPLTFVNPKCSSDTGQTKQCSDAKCPVVNNADDCEKTPSLYKSDCATYKLSVYNFTKGLPTSGAPTGGARVDVFPSDPTSAPLEFDVLEYFFGELCVHGDTAHNCPGQETSGKPWLNGDKTAAKKTPGVVKIGADEKTGDIGDCDGVFNKLLRNVGVVGFVFLVLGLIVLLVGCGFGGYKLYQKKKLDKQFPSLDVGINDPGAGTSADFNYADIDSVVS